MDIKVSVIVPCYNVEKYVGECLQSICNQTLEDIEIICINDGSQDNTLSIINEFKQKDTRIKVINKENTGYGHSVNMGIDVAIGKYIGIVESDDFIEPNMYDEMYNVAEFYNLEVCRCCYYEYHSQNKLDIKKDFPFVPKNVVFCPIDDNQAPFWQQPTVWINLYNRKWLQDNKIRFLETAGASYQDVSFSFKVYSKVKRFLMLEDAFLHYRVDNENSSINSTNKTLCVCNEWQEIKKFVNTDKDLKNKVCQHTIPCVQLGNYRWNYNRIINNPNRYNFIKQWSNELREYIKDNNLQWKLYTKKERRQLFIIAYLPFIFKILKIHL